VRLKIVQAGDPILRQTARPLTHQEILGDEIQRLIQDQKSAAMYSYRLRNFRSTDCLLFASSVRS
jgi:peptide deformylase